MFGDKCPNRLHGLSPKCSRILLNPNTAKPSNLSVEIDTLSLFKVFSAVTSLLRLFMLLRDERLRDSCDV